MNFYETETDTVIENRAVVAKGEGRMGGGLGVWDWQMQTIIYTIDKQQGSTVQHRKLYSISCNKPMEKKKNYSAGKGFKAIPSSAATLFVVFNIFIGV